MSETGQFAPGQDRETSSGSFDCTKSEEHLISTIYQTVGESLDLEPDADPIPIADVVDPEALVRLFAEHSGETYVSFPVADRRVTVHSDGSVIVHDFDP